MTAMGAKHWGVRWPPLGRAYGYNSYVLERNGTRMLLACDSAPRRCSSARLEAARHRGLLDRGLRSVDSQSRQSRSRCGRCSSKAARATWCRFIGDVPALQGADGRTDAPADRRGRAARADRCRDTANRGGLELAGGGAAGCHRAASSHEAGMRQNESTRHQEMRRVAYVCRHSFHRLREIAEWPNSEGAGYACSRHSRAGLS